MNEVKLLGKLTEEDLVGHQLRADDYILVFKVMIELKNEKLTHQTFEFIEVRS